MGFSLVLVLPQRGHFVVRTTGFILYIEKVRADAPGKERMGICLAARRGSILKWQSSNTFQAENIRRRQACFSADYFLFSARQIYFT